MKLVNFAFSNVFHSCQIQPHILSCMWHHNTLLYLMFSTALSSLEQFDHFVRLNSLWTCKLQPVVVDICTVLMSTNFYLLGLFRDIFGVLTIRTECLQCFDTVGWAAGRASGP